MLTDTDRSPIDAWIVALNETRHYNIEPEDADKIAEIRGVYLFDRNERTHCCELTPSHWLVHLYDQVVLTGDLDDEVREELYERYENHGGDDKYVHCHDIDRLIERGRENNHYVHVGAAVSRSSHTPVSYDEMDHDEQMESLREHYCGNHEL